MPQTRPNILLLVGEDVGRHFGCYGDAYARTPNLDRLAAEGALYTNAFSTAPVCAPSRSCLVSGKYQWAMGSHPMRSVLVTPPRLFTHELRDAGYFVNWHTKRDFNFVPDDGFADACEPWLDDLRAGRLPEDKPFFLYQNFDVTHESTMWRDGGGQADNRKAKEHLLAPEQRHDPSLAPVPAYLPDTDDVRADIARYYDAVSIHDAEIGAVLDALDASPYRADTVVIYLSDHGRGLLREKRWCYDAGIHLPLIVRDPRDPMPGAVRDELVSWVDVAPTILSLAGVPAPEDYHGAAFLGGRAGGERAYAFAGRDRMDECGDRVRAVREKRFHYIRNEHPELPYAQRLTYLENQRTTRVARDLHARGELSTEAALFFARQKPPEELYDAVADPDMVHNLAEDPAYARILTRMRAALDEHRAAVPDLGLVPERELVRRGVIQDALADYAERVAPLPEGHEIGDHTTPVLEPEEADSDPGGGRKSG